MLLKSWVREEREIKENMKNWGKWEETACDKRNNVWQENGRKFWRQKEEYTCIGKGKIYSHSIRGFWENKLEKKVYKEKLKVYKRDGNVKVGKER